MWTDFPPSSSSSPSELNDKIDGVLVTVESSSDDEDGYYGMLPRMWNPGQLHEVIAQQEEGIDGVHYLNAMDKTFKIDEQPGDGHCFFHTMASQLYGRRESGIEYRQSYVARCERAWLENPPVTTFKDVDGTFHPLRFRTNINCETEQEFRQWLELRKGDEYATAVDIFNVAGFENVTIKIVDELRNIHVVEPYRKRHEEIEEVWMYHNGDPEAEDAHLRGNHYDALVQIDDAEGDSPASDPLPPEDAKDPKRDDSTKGGSDADDGDSGANPDVPKSPKRARLEKDLKGPSKSKLPAPLRRLKETRKLAQAKKALSTLPKEKGNGGSPFEPDILVNVDGPVARPSQGRLSDFARGMLFGIHMTNQKHNLGMSYADLAKEVQKKDSFDCPSRQGVWKLIQKMDKTYAPFEF
jgi:hypothetical protein